MELERRVSAPGAGVRISQGALMAKKTNTSPNTLYVGDEVYAQPGLVKYRGVVAGFDGEMVIVDAPTWIPPIRVPWHKVTRV